MAFKFFAFLLVVCWQNLSFAGDAFTSFQSLYNSSTTPASWTSDFSVGAYTHCEMSASSSPTQTQSILFGQCSFNDGSKNYQAPCYLPASANVSYGFVLNNSPAVYGNSVQVQGKDLAVTNARALVIANYRRSGAQMIFKLGSSDISYGSCSR